MSVETTLNTVEDLLNKKKHSDAQGLLDSLKTIPKSKYDAARFDYLQAYCFFQQIEARVFINGGLNTKLDLNDILKTLDNAKELCQQARLKMKGSNSGPLCKYIDEMQEWILKLQANLCWDYSLFNVDHRYTLDEYERYKNNALMAQKYYEYFSSSESLRLCKDHISAIDKLIQQIENSDEQPNKKKKIEEDDEEATSSVDGVDNSQARPFLIRLFLPERPRKTRSNSNIVEDFDEQYDEIKDSFLKYKGTFLQRSLNTNLSKLDDLFEQCRLLRNDANKQNVKGNNKTYLMQVDIRKFQANICGDDVVDAKNSNDNSENPKKLQAQIKLALKYYKKYDELVSDPECPLKKAEKDELKSKIKIDIDKYVKKIAEIEELIAPVNEKENISIEKQPILIRSSLPELPRNTRRDTDIADILAERYREKINQYQELKDKVLNRNSLSTISRSLSHLDVLFEQCKTLRMDIEKHKGLTNRKDIEKHKWLAELDKKIFYMQADIRKFQADDCWDVAVYAKGSNDFDGMEAKQCNQLNQYITRAHGYYEEYHALLSGQECPLKKKEKDELKSKVMIDIAECVKELAKIEKAIASLTIETDEDAAEILKSFSFAKLNNADLTFFQAVQSVKVIKDKSNVFVELRDNFGFK